ncbi:MAG TPA: DUF4337 domain-containing protein [Polyangia bacterium]|jgi:hypothetical protein|nr:DUF4337 domain-containing protein [Polyangia bacterium]
MSPTAQEDDIQELIRSIAEERRTAKEKEKRESWTKYVSLMVVVLAVATGIGSLKAGGFSTKVVLNQQQASDEWAYYQAKSIKQRVAEMEARGATGPVAAAAAEDVARYKNDQKVSQAKAQHLEELRDDFGKHGRPMGFGIALLQISIALASVCLLTKRKALWMVSGLLGAIGIGYVIFGLYLV